MGTLSADLSLQPRFYYNVKKRLERGANPRSFPGTYIAAVFNSLSLLGRREIVYETGKELETLNGSEHLELGLVWGAQERFSKKGFVDIQVGMLYNTESRSWVNNKPFPRAY